MLRYLYDDLGQLSEVKRRWWDATVEEVVGSYSRTTWGEPTAVQTGGASWTYASAGRHGQVTGRQAPLQEERFTWDGQGRLERLAHRDPEERYVWSYTYDGAGRLSEARKTLPSGIELERTAVVYGRDHQVAYELRTGALGREVWRHGGVRQEGSERTSTLLPMVRRESGHLRFVVAEPTGEAAWLLDDQGIIRGEYVSGAFGEKLVDSGQAWVQDGLHGSEPEASLGLIHHGVRHARTGDGLWLQPEPYLRLGVPEGRGLPLGYGPTYAAGDPIGLSDRSGMNPLLLVGAWTYYSSLHPASAAYYDSLTLGFTAAARDHYGLQDPRDPGSVSAAVGEGVAFVATAVLAGVAKPGALEVASMLLEPTDAQAAPRRKKGSTALLQHYWEVVVFSRLPKPKLGLGRAASNGADLHRPYIRKRVRAQVEARAPRDASGRPLDPNTGAPIEGIPDLGHKRGHEFRRKKAAAEAEGLTQKEFNDRMNDPDLYQLEDPSSNRSRRYERKP